MEQIKETAFDWTSRESRGYVTSNEKSMIQKIVNYANTRPTEVTIIKEPQNNGGYLMARVPKSWGKITPPRKRTVSEEQRAVLVNRLRKNKTNPA